MLCRVLGAIDGAKGSEFRKIKIYGDRGRGFYEGHYFEAHF